MAVADTDRYFLDGVDVGWLFPTGVTDGSPATHQPVQPGEYADALRAMGQFLTIVHATQVEMAWEGDRLLASWQQADERREERWYDPEQLAALRSASRLFRGLADDSAVRPHVQALRVLGDQLDHLGAQTFALAEREDGFHVLAMTPEGQVEKRYARAELSGLAEELRQRRVASPERPVASL